VLELQFILVQCWSIYELKP